MRLITLASGSSGNSTLIEMAGKRILVDCGIASKRIVRNLAHFGIDATTVDAILITHEHNDHIRGVDVFARRYGVPIYMSMNLFASRKRIYFTEGGGVTIRPFFKETPFYIGDISIVAFPLPHDVIDNVGFLIESDEDRIGYATDIGKLTPTLFEYLEGVDHLVIESNHDREMLENGPYPPELKERIRSDLGHISNTEAKMAVDRLYHPGMKHIILAHLSKINNTPEKALRAMGDLRYDVLIDVAPRFEPVDWTIGEIYASPGLF